MSGWYNGYSPGERRAKSSLRRAGTVSIPPAQSPCELCGDADSRVKYHSEDYSKPYSWDAPAVYALYRLCHARLHQRFRAPHKWEAFKALVRRGYYARETRAKRLEKFLRLGPRYQWPELGRRLRLRSSDGWWERLTTCPESRRSPWARPRP